MDVKSSWLKGDGLLLNLREVVFHELLLSPAIGTAKSGFSGPRQAQKGGTEAGHHPCATKKNATSVYGTETLAWCLRPLYRATKMLTATALKRASAPCGSRRHTPYGFGVSVAANFDHVTDLSDSKGEVPGFRSPRGTCSPRPL